MTRMPSVRTVVAMTLAGALAGGWLACGHVEDSEGAADAGVPPNDAQCPDCGAGFVCVYDAAGGCAATGACIAAFTGVCRVTPDIFYCPCDAARIPREVSGNCRSSENPEEPVRGPFGPGLCFGDQ